MSTDPGRLSQLDTFHSLPIPTSGFVPRRGALAGRLAARLQDLSIVVERLFTFYEGMRTGRPIADGDDKLAQLQTALAKSTRSRNTL